MLPIRQENPLCERAYTVMLHVAGLSLRDLSERYHVTMASRESVRSWFHRFSEIFSIEKRFRRAVAVDETVVKLHGFREYLARKKRFAEILVKKAEKIIRNLSQHIVVQDAATPKTFERYTSMPEGAIYSFDQSINVRRPTLRRR